MFYELKASTRGQLEWFQCAPEKRPFNRTPTVLFIPPFMVSVFVVCVCMCVSMCIYALVNPVGTAAACCTWGQWSISRSLPPWWGLPLQGEWRYNNGKQKLKMRGLWIKSPFTPLTFGTRTPNPPSSLAPLCFSKETGHFQPTLVNLSRIFISSLRYPKARLHQVTQRGSVLQSVTWLSRHIGRNPMNYAVVSGLQVYF